MKHKFILSKMPVMLVTTMLVTTLILIGCEPEGDRGVMATGDAGISNESVQQKVHEEPNFEAIVLYKNESTITVSPTKSTEQQYILGTTGVDYSAQVGDKVRVWTTGQYEDSYPSRGVATKIDQVK